MSRRVTFALDDLRAAEVESYAKDHGYASAGDFARVATLRLMSMYPSRRATPARETAGGESASPEVPHTRQDESLEEAQP
jgi:hypothetical protein